jgi:phospholipase A-2-activating protein
MTMMQEEWELSETLTSDGQGVRCACALAPSMTAQEQHEEALSLLTGTQGGGLLRYSLPSRSLSSHMQHDHAVTALVSLGPSSLYATACKDAIIRVFDSASHTLQRELKGHDKAVTSLAVAATEAAPSVLVSGSWDGTAKIWNVQQGSLIATLPNHENAVCVAVLPSNNNSSSNTLKVATGSAGVAVNNVVVDHAVRLWSIDVATGEVTLLKHVANDHDGPIRSLCFLPKSNQLASCSNDGTVKLRDASTGKVDVTLSYYLPSQQQQQQQQHPPILLHIAASNDDDDDSMIVACSEDGLLIIWNLLQDSSSSSLSNNEPQLIPHASTVWHACFLDNGDIVSSCQDGCVRIFTRATDRMAPLDVRNEWTQSIQTTLQQQAAGPSQDEISKLPDWYTAAAIIRGKSEGQVQLFQKDGTAIAAQWSADSQTWIEVGQVMGRGGGGGDGDANSSNGGNNNNTIEGVAYDHVFYIEVDVPGGGGGATTTSLRLGYNNGENPFVAAQRFIDAHVLPQYHLSQIADYITQRLGQGGNSAAGGGPMLGASTAAAAAVATTGVPIAVYQYLPMKLYKVFDLSEKQAATTMDKMKSKIQSFQKLTDAQMSDLDGLMETLQATNRYHATSISNEQLQIIVYMLENWEPEQAFPALDLARMVVLHPDAARADRASFWKLVVKQAIRLCQVAQTQTLDGPAAVGIPMLSLRFFTNAFKGGPGSLEAVAASLDGVLACGQPFVQSPNKNIRLSLATLIGNMCFYMNTAAQANNTRAFSPGIITLLDGVLTHYKLYEDEAMLRVIVGLGTLVMAVPQAKAAAQTAFLLAKVQPAASPHGEQAKTAAREVYSVLA